MKVKKIFASVSSNVGNNREKNQDNFCLNGKTMSEEKHKHICYSDTFDGGVFVVADGMGGQSLGEYASLVAVEAVREDIENGTKLDNITAVERCIDKANTRICKRMVETKERIGTTIAIVTVYSGNVNIYNVGDSRCFLYRDGALIQLSKDHTVVANLVEMNILTEEQAKTDKRRHQLSQHLGMFPEDITISVYQGQSFELAPDDVIIICSDGITDVLENDDIVKIIKSNDRVQRLSDELVFRAMEYGSKDNVTAMVIESCKKHKNINNKLSWIIGGVVAAAAGIVAGLATLHFLF